MNDYLTLRSATILNLDFLVEVDLKDEGCSSTFTETWGPAEWAHHRKKIAGFVLDEDKAAWMVEDTRAHRLVGTASWRYRNRLCETFDDSTVFGELDEALFPADGAFCEIFQLWIAPEFRRRGLASQLKRLAEAESVHRGVKLIYTHTEERNEHVLELNRKLGYREVRRGPIWDEVVRVSLIKQLG